MKKKLLYLTILVLPFLSMLVINELVRPTITEKPYTVRGISAMNSLIKTPKKCSWNCHNNTNYCKQHHVVMPKSLFLLIDPIYFGIILLLQLTGCYALANILILVILAPLFFYTFLIKSINIQIEINKIKKGK